MADNNSSDNSDADEVLDSSKSTPEPLTEARVMELINRGMRGIIKKDILPHLQSVKKEVEPEVQTQNQRIQLLEKRLKDKEEKERQTAYETALHDLISQTSPRNAKHVALLIKDRIKMGEGDRLIGLDADGEPIEAEKVLESYRQDREYSYLWNASPAKGTAKGGSSSSVRTPQGTHSYSENPWEQASGSAKIEYTNDDLKRMSPERRRIQGLPDPT